MGSDQRAPLLGQGGDGEEKLSCSKVSWQVLTNPFQMLPILAMLLITGLGAFQLFTASALFFVSMETNVLSLLCIIFLLVSTIPNAGCVLYIISKGGMKAQLVRFRNENKQLSKLTTQMTKNVSSLDVSNRKYELQATKLKTTMGELKSQTDDLTIQIQSFDALKGSITQISRRQGTELSQLLEQTAEMQVKMEAMAKEQERAHLLHIAQDLEFMDREKDLTEDQFARFVAQIPNHLKDNFQKLGKTFSSVAGSDKMVSHQEIAQLVDELLQSEEQQQLQETKEAIERQRREYHQRKQSHSMKYGADGAGV